MAAADTGLLPVLGWNLGVLALNQPHITLIAPHHHQFLRENKLTNKSQFWISDEEDRILVTLNTSFDPPRATIHWLEMRPVVVNGRDQ